MYRTRSCEYAFRLAGLKFIFVYMIVAYSSQYGISFYFRYFIPLYDDSKGLLNSICKTQQRDGLNPFQQEVCVEAKRREFKNELFSDSYLNHIFANTWIPERAATKLNPDKTDYLPDIVPGFKSVSERIGLKCDD